MTIFRTTQGVLANQVLENLQASMERMQHYHMQLSSGKRVAKPSDDPSSAVASMLYRSDKTRNEQYVRNAQDGSGWLGMSDNTLMTLSDQLGRIRDLVLQGVNGTQDDQSRAAIAREIRTTKDTIIGLANTTYQDRPIFSGTANPGGLSPALPTYALDGTFNGNNEPVYRTIGPGAQVQVNLTGPSVFGTPGADDLWSLIDDVVSRLESGDQNEVNKLAADWVSGGANVPSDLSRLDSFRVNIQNSLSEIGARLHRVDQMKDAAGSKLLTIEAGISNMENADLAKTITDMNLQSAAYQAALSATARVIQTSLVDFLR